MNPVTKEVCLPYVIPDYSKVVAKSAGLRPIREGGIRMQVSYNHQKTIYHNYGHGGAGLSIAYGCAKYVIEELFLPKRVGIREELAVLGGGIVGLTTAFLLIEMGYRVNLYTDLFPFEQIEGKPEITTTVAAGYWMPIKLSNRKQAELFAKTSWDHFEDVYKLQEATGRKLGLSKVPTYVVNDTKDMYMEIEGVIQPKDCVVNFGDGVKRPAKTFLTYVIESEYYLTYLLKEMQGTGRFKLFRQKVKRGLDLLQKKEQHIFNCTGMEGPTIVGDSKPMQQMKGHIMKYRLSDYPQVKDFVLALKLDSGHFILQIPQPQSNYFALGITYEAGKENPDPFVEEEEMKGIMDRTTQFYNQVRQNSIKPKL